MATKQESILTNARIVTPREVIVGSVAFGDGKIQAIDSEKSHAPGALDLEQDYLLPGLIEMHTDNLEKQLVPRPGVLWPSPLAALLAHDTQISGAGITTVLDALFIGDHLTNGARSKILGKSIEAIKTARQQNILRADHMLHMRCEVCDADVLEMLMPQLGEPLLRLVSVMDHTPGQRQWADLSKYRLFHREKKWTDHEFQEILRERMRHHERYANKHRQEILALCREKHLPVASHDDTTVEHAIETARDGITISEFPTTMAAAKKSRELDISIVMGAPNVVRGNSHSGNASARDLAKIGLLDGLSSDYYPVSLLHAPFVLNKELGIPISQAVSMVTHNIASFIGLNDRGQITRGKRADLVRVRICDNFPVVITTWREGIRVN
jgi:alpha-D-ribose 1-methylphosphonate 5-triphosphate diphosphatase